VQDGPFAVDLIPVESKQGIDLLDRLYGAVIAKMNFEFELYLDRRAIGPWDARRTESCVYCNAHVGETHLRGCSMARCKAHGQQRNSCTGEGKCAASRFWGVYPGTVEALKRGWVKKLRPSTSQIGEFGREPDINRVVSELKWNPGTERFE